MMFKGKSTSLSLFTFILLAISVLVGRLLLPRFETHDILAILSWDVFGYYLYLPATFIYHDLGLKDWSWLQHILDTYNPTIGFYQAYMGPGGEYIMKYTMGMAIIYSPFFFAGHLFAFIMGFPADGFSLPYQVSIAFGMVVYAMIGIWFLRKVLLKFFSEMVTSLTMILIVLGTNYFQLTSYDGAMPHNVLFTLYAVIVYLTILWHEKPRIKYAVLLGLATGLAILIRPTSAIIVLVPLLWGLFDKESLIRKWELFRSNFIQVLSAAVLLGFVPFMQILYWKFHSGEFFIYSYESDQKLVGVAPFLWYILFSFKKGWLIYAPMMVFPLIGLYSLGERNRQIFPAVFVFFIVNLFVIASWPTWWYGGSVGQRALMESYAVLAIPLGYFLQWLLNKNLLLKIPLFTVFLLFILLNLFQTWQYMNFIIDPSLMTREYYCAIFGKTRITNDDRRLIEGYKRDAWDFMEKEDQFNIRTLAFYDFEDKNDPYTKNLVQAPVKSGQNSFKMDAWMVFSPGIKIAYGDLTHKPQVGIRFSAWVYSNESYSTNSANFVVTSNHGGMNYRYEFLSLDKQKLTAGTWNQVTFKYLTPESPDPKDELQVYIWYRGKTELFVDDIKIELFEPK
jgi:hypothetical protein